MDIELIDYYLSKKWIVMHETEIRKVLIELKELKLEKERWARAMAAREAENV